MNHPYSDLPADRFWRPSVSNKSPFDITGLWKPRFRIKKRSGIITLGSCFAQHISRVLVTRGYRWIDAEPAPEQMTDTARRDYHYGVFSARTGNIYTPRMLNQWMNWASGAEEPPKVTWEKDGRHYDPFRPAVELNGFASSEEALDSRAVTVAALREAVETAQFLVFTLGLTESWHDSLLGVEYAACPGTIAGTFDAERHHFVNHGFQGCLKDLKSAFRLARKLNPKLKLILTVSPVPLTATATAQHVLTASTASKSILRAVAGELVEASASVDYFPSYEIITHPAFRGMFFEPNMRSVSARGVDFVMDQFFGGQQEAFSRKVQIQGPYGVVEEKVIGPDQPLPKRAASSQEQDEDASEAVLCEEEMLDAFSR